MLTDSATFAEILARLQIQTPTPTCVLTDSATFLRSSHALVRCSESPILNSCQVRPRSSRDALLIAGCIRQHTSAYVSIRSSRDDALLIAGGGERETCVSIRQHTSAYGARATEVSDTCVSFKAQLRLYSGPARLEGEGVFNLCCDSSIK